MKYAVALICATAAIAQDGTSYAAEFGKRWTATRKMTIGVAEAMRSDEYAFKPDPPSMTFAEQMLHIGWADYAFCSALKDEKKPDMKEPAASAEKDAIVKYVADSWDYCSRQIAAVTAAQMNATHSTPDGKLNGRELLLALYVHLAHHRGQAEIYLRIKGIAPPPYVF